MLNFRANGIGRYEGKNIYLEGTWVEDKLNGQGIRINLKDGRKYCGNFLDGKPEGFGKFMYKDGCL